MAIELLTISEVAALLRVSEQWCYRNLNFLPSIRVGHQIRFHRDELERWTRKETSKHLLAASK